MPRKYTEYVSYEYTMKKIASPSTKKDINECDNNDNDDDVDGSSEKKFFKKTTTTSNNDLNNNLIDNNNVGHINRNESKASHKNDDEHHNETNVNHEYDPYSYGFRPLSERNIYRSFEIIRTPTETNTDEKKSTKTQSQQQQESTIVSDDGPFDEIDNSGHMKHQTQNKFMSSEEGSSIINKNREGKFDEYTIPTIMVNERPVDVPGYNPLKHQSKSPKMTKNQDSESRKSPRVIEIKVQKSSDEMPKDSNSNHTNTATISTTNDSNWKKPPLPPNHGFRRRTSMPVTTGHRKQQLHQQQQQPRPSSSSAIHSNHYHDNNLQIPKVWPDFHHPDSFHVDRLPFSYWFSDSNYYDNRRESISCPYSSPTSIDELMNSEPIPTKFHSYKCTRYELTKTTTTTSDEKTIPKKA
ncbi:hypothetical protein HUG17_3812 [Dermatophagoides farinae]|uniref:Uncharacterized protein n=1 Tax=Dermatophagoides farinae TaxID=6954 RepID=A0A9D4NW29_DERFA|nr:hypothetical protein HUG17_3812 [Dermatophagoides farinae]